MTQAYDSIAQGCVKVQHPGEDGYQLTLECDLAKIASEEQGNLFCSKISTVRSLVQGIPLRRIFTDLQQGKSTERAAICMRYRQNRAMYVKPLVDSVVVVFGSDGCGSILLAASVCGFDILQGVIHLW